MLSLLLLPLLPLVSAKLLASISATSPGASIRQIGSYNPNACPVQYPNCAGAANPNVNQIYSVQNGRFRFWKPANYDRAEVHGLAGHKFAEGKTYYLGWDFAVSAFPPAINCPDPQTPCMIQSNRIFQYHTFGSPNTLDIPLQLMINNGSNQAIFWGMKYHNGKDASNGRDMVPLWTSPPLVANTVYKIALMIGTSRNAAQGRISLWWNDVAQNLAGQGTVVSGQTWDGNSVDPKWGVYGAWNTELTTTIGRIRLGTTVKDVVP